MQNDIFLEESYLVLVEFLLFAKKQIFALGSRHAMSGMQVITLLLLQKPTTMSSIKNSFNCDPSNVTGIIDGLEQKRLVKRYESSTDRRTKMVKLLPDGRNLRQEILSNLALSENQPLSRLTHEDIKTLVKLIRKIIPIR